MARSTLLIALLSIFAVSMSAQTVAYDYHPHNKTVEFTSSNLPIVVIKLDEKMKPKDDDQRTSATITILDRKDGQPNLMSSISESPDYTDESIFNYYGKIGIKFRGNTSFNNNNQNGGYSISGKVPFTIRTVEGSVGAPVDALTAKKRDANILDMGTHYDWVLIAPFADKSLIRDALVFDLQRDYLEYSPRVKYCELVLEDVYQGVFVVTARARRGESRVDLPKPGDDGDALTGGYMLNIDRNDGEGFYSKNPNLTSDGNPMANTDRYYYTYFQCTYPDFVDHSPKQLNYIKGFIDDLEASLLSPDFDIPEYGGYRNYIDATSAIDYILTQEYTANADGYRLSTPVYKYNDERDPRLKFSLWDLNMSIGNINYLWTPGHRNGRPDTEGWLYYEQNDIIQAKNHSASAPFWFSRMMEDDSFVTELRQRWCQYRSTTHSDDAIAHRVDSMVVLLDQAQTRNYTAWNALQMDVFPEALDHIKTWEGQIEFVKEFLWERMYWMDEEFGLAPVNTITNGTPTPSIACLGVTVTITADAAPDDEMFYCWEGNDAGLLDNARSATATFTMPAGNVDITATYGPIIGTENADATGSMFVYPNPAEEYITIAGLQKNGKYEIVNQVGQTLQSGAATGGEAIDISALPTGYYIVKTGGASLSFVKR